MVYEHIEPPVVNLFAICNFLNYHTGHGPDSHLWEEFIKENTPDGSYRHEDMTLKVFFPDLFYWSFSV
jgi:hypothetical protein